MQGKIVKIVRQNSRYGGHFYYVFLEMVTGKACYSCVYPRMRNFKRWKNLLREGVVLKGLKLVKGKNKLIDADSMITEVEE